MENLSSLKELHAEYNWIMYVWHHNEVQVDNLNTYQSDFKMKKSKCTHNYVNPKREATVYSH